MNDAHEVRITEVPGPVAVDDTGGITLAVFRLEASGEVNLAWLPDLFSRPIAPDLKEVLVAKLRLHADKLESGEMEQRMARFANVNNPWNRSEREQ